MAKAMPFQNLTTSGFAAARWTGLAISVSAELLGRAELKLSVHATFFSVQSRL